MQILTILGFLILAGVGGWITQKAQAIIYKSLAMEGKEIALRFIVSLLIPLIVFVQYWLLTELFPLNFILLISGLIVLALLVQFSLEAVFGISTRATKRKMTVLKSFRTYQRFTQHPLSGCLTAIPIALMGVGVIVAAIWVYLVYPIGDPEAVVLLAVIIFAVPTVAALLSEIVVMWPVIFSPYTDNDIRMQHLVGSFSWMGQRVILLIFPFWLFEKNALEFLGELPPFWLLLTIPIVSLVFLGVFPFFIGLHRYRVEADEMLNWRTLWIDKLLEAVSLPPSKERTAAIRVQLSEIDDQIQERLNKHQVFRLFHPVEGGDGDSLLFLEDNRRTSDDAELAGADDLLIQDNSIKERITSAQDALKGIHFNPIKLPLAQHQLLIETLIDNKSQFIKWDIRFSHVSELLKLYNNSLQADDRDITTYLNIAKQNISTQVKHVGRKRSMIGGAIIAIISIGVSALLRLFDDEILTLIRSLMASSEL